jgi:cephalosporin hydroxylase
VDVDAFHRLYYDSQVWFEGTSWLGVPVQKCPLDLWVYQEILARLRPALILETGTAGGGSALFLASVCDLLGHGRVLTVDIAEQEGRPRHPRIRYLHGDSVAPDVVAAVCAEASELEPVVVILDSDHELGHVRAELRAYAPLVTLGSYLIVEDTNLNGHPVLPEFGPGPREALAEFLAKSAGFVVDCDCEKFGMTFNPGGYLRRVA